MTKEYKRAAKRAYKISFQLSTAFLINWVNYFDGATDMPTVPVYRAQLKLRGVTI